MAKDVRTKGYLQYKNRINHLFSFFENNEPELQSHNAKYLAVLVSGYMEQAVKELLLGYVQKRTKEDVLCYIKSNWPISKNMSTANIEDILKQFSSVWAEEFKTWLSNDEYRKNNINSVVQWRNSIAHGQESNTTGVTLVSVKSAFKTVSEFVSFIENMTKG